MVQAGKHTPSGCVAAMGNGKTGARADVHLYKSPLFSENARHVHLHVLLVDMFESSVGSGPFIHACAEAGLSGQHQRPLVAAFHLQEREGIRPDGLLLHKLAGILHTVSSFGCMLANMVGVGLAGRPGLKPAPWRQPLTCIACMRRTTLTELDECIRPRHCVHLRPIQPPKLIGQLFQVLECEFLGIPLLRQCQEHHACINQVLKAVLASLNRHSAVELAG